MLTNDDLKEIRKVVREEVESEFQISTRDIASAVRNTNLHMRDGFNRLENRMKDLEINQNSMKKDLTTVKKKVINIEKTVNVIIKTFDEESVQLQKRVKKIEQHLNQPQN